MVNEEKNLYANQIETTSKNYSVEASCFLLFGTYEVQIMEKMKMKIIQ